MSALDRVLGGCAEMSGLPAEMASAVARQALAAGVSLASLSLAHA